MQNNFRKNYFTLSWWIHKVNMKRIVWCYTLCLQIESIVGRMGMDMCAFLSSIIQQNQLESISYNSWLFERISPRYTEMAAVRICFSIVRLSCRVGLHHVVIFTKFNWRCDGNVGSYYKPIVSALPTTVLFFINYEHALLYNKMFLLLF